MAEALTKRDLIEALTEQEKKFDHRLDHRLEIQRQASMDDFRTILKPINDRLVRIETIATELKQTLASIELRVQALRELVHDDVNLALTEIEALKRELTTVKKRLHVLEHSAV